MAAASSNIIDLDAQLAGDIAEALKARKWNKIKLFGQEWRITTEPNVFAALAGSYGDIPALVSILTNVVHPDERTDFHRAMLDADGINAEVLMKLINGIVEASAERPTKSPSGSSRPSGKTQVAKRNSAAT
jgi:hypothetical protein